MLSEKAARRATRLLGSRGVLHLGTGVAVGQNDLAHAFIVHSRCCEFFERPVLNLPDFTAVTAKLVVPAYLHSRTGSGDWAMFPEVCEYVRSL